MMKKSNFAVFIITHGRPNNQFTTDTLRKGNYTGKIYYILDDEDETIEEYYKNYGKENCIVFHKEAWFDIGDNLTGYKGVPEYARNECFRIAKELGIDYFVELDDDYKKIMYRYEKDGKLAHRDVDNFDELFKATIKLLDIDNIYCVAYGVEGDFIGGLSGKYKERFYRNARNSFFCKTDKEFRFLGRINEDVTTPAYHNMIGKLFYTILSVQVNLFDHKKNVGGSTDQYKEVNTYWNYFYPVLWCPSAIKIKEKDGEFIKKIEWNNLLPQVINKRWKK